MVNLEKEPCKPAPEMMFDYEMGVRGQKWMFEFSQDGNFNHSWNLRGFCSAHTAVNSSSKHTLVFQSRVEQSHC